MDSLNDDAFESILVSDFKPIVANKNISLEKLSEKLNSLDKEALEKIKKSSVATYIDFEEFIDVKNINELTQVQKRKLMNIMDSIGVCSYADKVNILAATFEAIYCRALSSFFNLGNKYFNKGVNILTNLDNNPDF